MPPRPSVPATQPPPAARERLRRLAWPMLVIAAGLALLWLVALLFVFRSSPGWGFDFEAYLLAAQRLARGDSIYLPWTVDGAFQPGPYGLYLYAPPLAVLVLPFTAVSVPAATAVWFVLRAAILVAGVALMPVRAWIRLLVFVIAVLSAPVLTDLNLGNISIVILFLTVVGWRFMDRTPAAVALAVSLAVRPTYVLFLAWWLLRRQWRPVVICLVTGAILILVTLPFVGVAAYADYFKLVRNLSDLTTIPNNLDLGSTATRLGLGGWFPGAALIAGYAIAIGAMLFSLRRDREVSYMVTLGGTLLISPLLQDHFLVAALIPAAFLLERGRLWGLVLAVLAMGWVPLAGVPLVALAAMLAPFLAPPKVAEPYAGVSPGATADPASKRTTAPA